MEPKKPKIDKRFKLDDYNKAVDLMRSRKVFSGPKLMLIANELNIPKKRMYSYLKRYKEELGSVLTEEKAEELTTTVIIPSKLDKLGQENMDMMVDELEKLTRFKWDGMQFIIACIAEFRSIIADPHTSLADKIKLFKLMIPYVASEIPTESTGPQNGEMLSVANIYTQAQNFYQQQNIISNETTQGSSSRNKKK